jgi:hypothetical protein
MSKSVYDRIDELCQALLKADSLSATLQSFLESAPAVGDARTAAYLADEIAEASSQVEQSAEVEADVKQQLADLAAALRELASGRDSRA